MVAMLSAATAGCSGGGGGGGGAGSPTIPDAPPSDPPPSTPPSDPPATGTVVVNLTGNLSFDPPQVRIARGATIRWVNQVNLFHTITPDGHSEWTRQEMNDAGDAFEHAFNRSGTFRYFCEPHRAFGMIGTITVE